MGGWLGLEGVGGNYTTPDYKTRFYPQPPSLSIHRRMGWTCWEGLQCCSFPCRTVSEKSKREKLFTGCPGHPGEVWGVGSTLVRRGPAGRQGEQQGGRGELRATPCEAGGCAELGT